MRNNSFKNFESYLQNVPRETIDKFTIYAELILKWQNSINIVSRGTIPELWDRHFLDSIQISDFIENKDLAIADLGSGAGFPGMVLALYGYNNITLIEKNKKKVAFLRQVACKTHTQVIIKDDPIENSDLNSINVFISRALGSIKTLLNLIQPFTNKETCCIFLKGENVKDEIDEAKKIWNFDHTLHNSLTHDKSKIVFIKNIMSQL